MVKNDLWIEEFRRKHNRYPRILHVGNIANNAYQNAKALNEMGCDCDVLSYDYYHIMGCPEWADAEINGDIGNSFYPRWNKVDLNGFKRPEWFVAGPLSLCVKYLLAKREGKEIKSKIYFCILNYTRNYIAKIKGRNKHTVVSITAKVIIKSAKRVYGLLKKVNINDADEGKGKNNIVKDIEKEFKRIFPERRCEFGKGVAYFCDMSEVLRPVLEKYDIAIMYSICPIFSYLSGYENYIAYEHGTIRDLPYEDDDLGRLLLLSYAKARAIYSTNVDCYDSAKYIAKNTRVPIICGLHGIDVDGIIKKMNRASNMFDTDGRFGIPDNKTVFFCPSRHDYDKAHGIFLKGDEKLLESTKRLAEEFTNFVLVLVEWGNDTKKIKNIIFQSKELADKIQWIKPVNQLELFKIYQSVDAVLDQFFCNAYGGITFETLAAGHSVLISSAANEDDVLKYYGSSLPYFSCENVEDIYQSMKEVIERSEKYWEYAKNGQKWVRKYHSRQKIVERLDRAFSYCNL